MQHSGGRHFEKSKNRHILAAVAAISTKFDRVTQFGPCDRLVRYKYDAYWPSKPEQQLKFRTFKNPRWRTAASLKKRKM